MNFDRLETMVFLLLIIIVIVTVLNFSIVYSANQKVMEATRLTEQQKIPAKLELIEITDSSCSECFMIDAIIDGVRKANVNITSEKSLDMTSDEAKKLIEKYDIKKIPTVVMTGEVNNTNAAKLWDNSWRTDKSTYAYYLSVEPPYTDALTGQVKGLVSLTNILASSCLECSDLSQLISILKEGGVKFSEEKSMEYNSTEAQGLIIKFNISKVPAIIISKDILDYEEIQEVWSQLNTTEKEGFYSLSAITPPYINVKKNKTEGLVNIIYLNDSSCTSCYNVILNKNILESNLGIVLENETLENINSINGKNLLSKYNITKVPIIILSPEASLYSGFEDVWQQVGDIASDGWYVMRNPGLVGTYRDLEKNQTVSRITLYAGDNQYQPKAFVVKNGDLVIITFVNLGQNPHTFAIDEFGIRSRVFAPRESGSIEFTANITGIFKYYSYYADDRENGLEGIVTIE